MTHLRALRLRCLQLIVILMLVYVVPCCSRDHVDHFDVNSDYEPSEKSSPDSKHPGEQKPRGKLGGHCEHNSDCSSTPNAICFEEHCNCESGYVARTLILDDQSACFGIEGSPCRSQSEFLKIADFLKDNAQFTSKLTLLHQELDNLGDADKEWANMTLYITKLEIIEKEGLVGKQEEPWSCYGGTCVNGKCGPGISKAAVTLNIQLIAESGSRRLFPSATTGTLLVTLSMMYENQKFSR